MLTPWRTRLVATAAARAARTAIGESVSLSVAARRSRVPARLMVLILFTVPSIGALLATASLLPTDAAAPPMESVLRQRDIEPGVPPMFEFLASFTASCATGPDPQVLTEPSGGGTIASKTSIQFCRFAPSQDLAIEIRQPDGTTMQYQNRTNDLGNGEMDWFSVPGEPLGVYTVTATQGPRRATGTFTISAPSAPTVVVFPSSAPPGAEFRVALAGFPPRQRVPLRLYRDIGGVRAAYWYVGTTAVVTTDERGQAQSNLQMQPNDPIDRYLLFTDPSAGRSGTFDLRP